MSVLHVFDMDGTLLSSTASVELARYRGLTAEIAELERLSAGGELTNREFHRRTHPWWQELDDAAVDHVFDNAPWIENVRQVWSDILARGETIAVISMSPLFFVRRLRAWGAGSVHASDNPIGAPFDDTLILEDTDKVAIVERLTRDGGFHRDRIIAYGDSYTDLPLFKTGISSVAVNATATVETLATRIYRGNDLLGAYALARELLTP